MVDGWWETSLPTLLSDPELEYIYNSDEFGNREGQKAMVL